MRLPKNGMQIFVTCRYGIDFLDEHDTIQREARQAPMKRITLVVCFCLLLGSSLHAQGNLDQRIDDLSHQITSKISAKQKTTIAVVEFADLEGHVTNLGRFLAEELITRLHETDKFKVIERQLLNKVISEQKLTLTGWPTARR